MVGNGQFVLGQIAEIRLDVYKEGEKKNLFFTLVHLDESNFLKPDFGYSKENIVDTVVSNKQINHFSYEKKTILQLL